MKAPFNFILLFLAMLPLSIAQTSLASGIDRLPTCALKCLTTAIAKSPCSLTNQTCVCTNEPPQASVTGCVMQTCTIKQALLTKNVTSTTCRAPVRDRSGLYSTVSTTLAVISAACVLLRVTYKLVLSMAELGMDDYFIFITLIAGVPSSVINVRGMAANGLGRDVWTLSYSQITNFVRFFYVMEVLYFAQVTLLKLSLLFFYQRIFPGIPVRRVIWATITFNSLFGAIFVNSWDGEHKGKCININALGWSNAAISIALDIWMLAIPLSQLVHLKLAWKKKVGAAVARDKGGIAVSKTFEIDRGDHDEARLVEMDDLTSKSTIGKPGSRSDSL
ncbi:hypothetical protein K469DRAFT_737689 [Zopfia rhizophila CBS 207.26]|uniref:CFEM domain-containing protein n=1 Tax=Zopfia rhizophila CBS 207.26 TaxID=1314779 RepID=A0A6A6ECX2_9PEZI|nr:hypothetical protein K469DRAFT_737689 [Zopfia rhizophila CBS 207.26]